MQISRLDSLGEPTSARRQDALPRGGSPARRKQVRLNPWVVICILAIAGWFLDSVLISIELHRLDPGDVRAHLTHLWYGPPILFALLLLMRAVLPKVALWAPRFTANRMARWGRRTGVKRLADRLAAQPVQGTLIGVLLRYPNTAMTDHDLAGHATISQGAVDAALFELVRLGLVEEMQVAEIHFYRLTRHGRAYEELRELQEWHREWQSQADRLFRVAVPGSGYVGMEIGGHLGSRKSTTQSKDRPFSEVSAQSQGSLSQER